MDRVEYEPVSVKAVLSEMKDTAELLIDLSYSAVLLGDEAVAAEVLDLEERMDLLQLQARMSLMLAARSPDDAESLAPVLGVVGAAEKISDAAGDIAKIVLEDVGLPEATRAALPTAVETLARAAVTRRDAPPVGTTLAASNLETETGVRVIAVRRRPGPAEDNGDGDGNGNGNDDGDGGGEWLLNPDRETVLRVGDVAILRGPKAGVADVYRQLTGEAYERPAAVDAGVEDLERALDTVVLMKNASELAVDLAYGSVLYDSTDVARAVVELEAEVDSLQTRLEAWTLRAAARVEDPVALRGLVHLAAATELISDAALEISEGVLRGLGSHPVVAEAVYDSDEVIVRLTVGSDADLAGTTLGAADIGTETGCRVIAVRRAGVDAGSGLEEWVVSPGPDTELRPGDAVLAKGTRTGLERLAALAGDEFST